MICTDLMTSINIPALVAEAAKIRAALARVDEARKAADEASQFLRGLLAGSKFEHAIRDLSPMHGLELNVDKYRSHTTNDRTLNAACWAIALERSQIWQSMDRATREKWDKAIHEGGCIDFTAEAVVPTLTAIRDARGEMFTAGLLQVFRGLSWCYKSNSPVKLENRQVITYALDHYSGSPRINHTTEPKLDDLYRVLCALDGKPEPTREASIASLANQFWRENRGQNEYNGDPYLRLVAYGNGNVHLWHKRPDLLDKANRLMGEAQPFASPSAVRGRGGF